jgi:hypothetical protein
MDTVNHPEHYQQCAAETTPIVRLLGVSNVQLEQEAIEVIEELGLNFRVGNAIKYLWRAGRKGYSTNDLEKARWYIQREIDFGGKRLELERAIELIDGMLQND